jgi:hypothetical protein
MMKRGKLKVSKDYNLNAWVIQGKKNGIWVNVSDGSKNLTFDLKYDACAYLQGLIDWVEDKNKINNYPKTQSTTNNVTKQKSKQVSKAKKKIIKRSKRRNW